MREEIIAMSLAGLVVGESKKEILLFVVYFTVV